MERLDVLYRGPLASCNFSCSYCPFAKREDDRAALAADADALVQFVTWIRANADRRFGILFTPWGEALVRRWYREAMVELSQLQQVERVVCQTNGSWPLDWLGQADRESLALWVTYHPGEVELATFAERCRCLVELGVRFSVGAVGCPAHLDAIEQLRRLLPSTVYLWINAEEGRRDYADEQIARMAAVDPQIHTSLISHPSRGRACRTGHHAITVDGNGAIRRCHFVDEVIGSIHDPDWAQALRARPCPNGHCDCYIGYVHLEPLGLHRLYGTDLLERIPEVMDWANASRRS